MDTSLLGGLVFVAVFAGLILVHEIGHFIAARFFNVEVEEFGIGIPPRMLTLFNWRGTNFTLNWLPFGGFVRLKGENDPSVPGGLATANPWVRIAVLLAGSTMNLLTAVLVYTLIFNQLGIPNRKVVLISEVNTESPAELAGFQVGDVIINANGRNIDSTTAMREVIYSNLDQPFDVYFERDGLKQTLTVTPSSERAQEQGAIGVLLANPLVKPTSWFQTIPVSLEVTTTLIREILTLPGRLIMRTISSDQARFVGFKGIYDFFQAAVERDTQSRTSPDTPGDEPRPTAFTLNLIAYLAISLGVLNLLPIPALDGGRIFFILPELIFRRRVSPQLENAIHGISFMILIGLLIYINIMDFINPVQLPLP